MKFSSLFFTRQNVTGLVLVISALWLMFANTKQAGTAAQFSKRTIENKIPPQVPLEIEIKKEKLDRIKEASNKTWYRDVEVQIKNTSKKPIYYFTLFAELPGVTDNGATIVFDITFGRKDFTEFNLKPLPDDKPLMPGEVFTYSIPEEAQIAWEAWQKRTGKREVEKIEIQFNHLSFGDGTGFTSRGAVPYPVKKDPEELGRCTDQDPPPKQRATDPVIFSALYAMNFQSPAPFVPVKFFPESSFSAPISIFTRYLLSRHFM